MGDIDFSSKGRQLIEMYGQMAREGYDRSDEQHVEVAFSDFELRPFRPQIREILQNHAIRNVLDYGCGGSDWNMPGFDDNGQSAVQYFNLESAYRYEPARGIDERRKVDCVVSFDVLEHIFVADVPKVLRDIYSCAGRLVILNVACYPAQALLPNGENAHITVRQPLWWKGMVDCITPEFPNVTTCLICSTAWRQATGFPQWSGNGWQASETFVIAN